MTNPMYYAFGLCAIMTTLCTSGGVVNVTSIDEEGIVMSNIADAIPGLTYLTDLTGKCHIIPMRRLYHISYLTTKIMKVKLTIR